MFSQVQLLGNVGRDPELNVTPDGTPVTKFSIAVNKRGKNERKPDETTWYSIVAWRGLAETLERYVHKGDMLFVQGELSVRTYTTKDGKPGYSLEVTVDKFSFAGSKNAGTGNSTEQRQGNEDPFLADLPETF